MTENSLGKGISFPIRLDSNGKISLSEYEEDIRESILIILGTSKGERIMNPDFGCGIHDYVFAHLDVSTTELIKSDIKTSLSIFEPRIEVIRVNIDLDTKSQGVIIISIDYKIKVTGNQLNLDYLFPMEGA